MSGPAIPREREEYGLLTPEALANPYPVYERLRAADPVHRGRMGEWVLTRYDDVSRALRDERLGNNLFNTDFVQARVAQMDDEQAELLRQPSMLQADPPDHTRLRKLVSRAFTPRTVERLRPRVRDIVEGLLARAAPAGSMDVIAELAYPLPITVICELLGIPVADRDQFRAWGQQLVDNPGLDALDDPATRRRVMEAQAEFSNLMLGLAEQRRHAPREDLMSGLVAAEEEGDRLSERELVGTAVLLLVAGYVTTVNLIGNGLAALLRHPDGLQRLRDDPALVPSAVEEMLRYDSPVQAVSRVANEDIEVNGKTIRRHDLVIAQTGAANRDPEHFPEPDRFDLARKDNRHLSFGGGIHFCLGAPEHVKRNETSSHSFWMSASRDGSLIQATVGSLGGVGRRWRKRAGFAA